MFLTSLPLTGKTTNNYSWTGYHRENPETAPSTTEIKTDLIKGVREMATHWPHCPSPRPWLHYAERSPLRLQCLHEKGKTRGPTCSPSCVGVSTLVLSKGDYRSICMAQPLVIWLWWIRGEEVTTASTWILADHCHTWGAQVCIPTSSFVHLQNQVANTLWQRNLVEWGTELPG